jgi:O-antigen/teichoic acid export membrane protein
VSRSVVAYFLCMAGMSLLQTLILRRRVRTALGSGTQPRFRVDLWRRVLRFVGGTAIIGVLGTVLTQLDKVTLSNALSLDAFAYYSVAAATASATFFIAIPVVAAAFPEMSRCLARNDIETLGLLYHRTCQTVALLVIPLAAVAFVFAPELLRAYLADPVTAERVVPFYRLLLVGSALNVVMTPPFYLQLAAGWTSLSVWKNVLGVLAYVPALYWAVSRFGALGAAGMWICVNAAYVMFEVPVMHSRLLVGGRHMARWYFVDLGVPAVCGFLAALGGHFAASGLASGSFRLIVAGIFGAIGFGATVFVLRDLREIVWSRIRVLVAGQ